jgi:tartrate-resistant acid phosphatase type 5
MLNARFWRLTLLATIALESGCGDNVRLPETEGLPLDFQPTVAIIGDYGVDGPGLNSVADLVHSWQARAILTLGDNNYPAGGRDTIENNIGKHFRSDIDAGRFFPSMGNHDWDTESGAPFLEYFSLPGNERYYDVAIGDARFFIIDSDPREPDGIIQTSTQALWLKSALANANERWKIVLMHHSPYTSSSTHAPEPRVQWPFQAWGANLVITGHDHFYERLDRNGIPYLINGMGGHPSHYNQLVPAEGSQVWFNDGFGALALRYDEFTLTSAFVAADGIVRDTIVLP